MSIYKPNTFKLLRSSYGRHYSSFSIQNSYKCPRQTKQLLSKNWFSNQNKISSNYFCSSAHENGPSENDRASPDQLQQLGEKLESIVAKFFLEPALYDFVKQDVIWENNIRGESGTNNVTPEIISVEKFPQTSEIHLTWKIVGYRSYTQLFNVIRMIAMPSSGVKPKKSIEYDGIIRLTVNSDGLVTKIVIDNVIPSSEKELNEGVDVVSM